MFDSMGTLSRRALLPAQALRLFDFYMKGTRIIDDDNDILMELCLDADSALSRMQRPARISHILMSSASIASNENLALRQNIAIAYHELARLYEQLGHSDSAQRRARKAEKWGYVQGNSANGNNNSDSSDNSTGAKQGSSGASSTRSNKVVPALTNTTIPEDIFDHNEPPTIIRHSLPDANTHLNDIHQLVYCLSLLSIGSVSTSDLNDREKEWCQAISNDQDEHERLHKLASDVIDMFINEDIKTESTVTEVVALTPILDQAQFRRLLMTLVNGISQNIMLAVHLLEGLAQLMQNGPSGYLGSDDLVLTLNTLSSRLQGTHGQSGDHLYRLSAAVSHVLDVMVNNQVKGLKREQLHEPLA
ncbi:hypothetical protein BX616_007328, partial [Lobosporangium transversale]